MEQKHKYMQIIPAKEAQGGRCGWKDSEKQGEANRKLWLYTSLLGAQGIKIRWNNIRLSLPPPLGDNSLFLPL